MKQQKYNNLLAFLDLLFCITMTYIALFVLSVIQIKQIEVTKEDHQALKLKYESVLTDSARLRQENSNKQISVQLLSKEISTLKNLLQSKETELQSAQKDVTKLKNDATKLKYDSAKLKNAENKLADAEQQIKELKEKQSNTGIGNWKTTAKIAIEISWNKTGTEDDDIDIYIQSPDKKITYFGDRMGKGFFIDRDDTGKEDVSNQTHKEVTKFFGFSNTSENPYLVNLHVYSKRSNKPTVVTFKLLRIEDNNISTMFEKEVVFMKEDQIEPIIEIKATRSRDVEEYRFSTAIPTSKKIPNILDIAKASRERDRLSGRLPPSNTTNSTPSRNND